MDDILKELGWGDGFRIPVANAENRALELEIQKKLKDKENLKFTLESVTERVAGMKNHLENVKHQLDVNQNLIYAHGNQKNAEENLVKLARTEDNSLVNEIKKVKKEEEEINVRLTKIQMDLDRTLQNIERLNATIRWDKDALLAWDEETCRGDDDTRVLEKFRKEDEAKFKEMELKRVYLGAETETKRNRLINLKNDVSSMEQSLDKTAQMFRKQQVDRRCLVQQWESSVRILHQRDEDINRAMEEIGNLKTLAKERLKDLEEQKAFFENEEKNNQEVQKEIEMFNKLNSDAKDKIRMLEVVLMEESDQMVTLKTVVASASVRVKKEILKQKSLLKEIEEKNKQLVDMCSRRDKAKEECEKLKNKTVTATERVVHLEKMLQEEEKTVEKNLMEFKRLDELSFQVVQQICELKEGEKVQLSGMQHIESCSATVRKEIAKAKVELSKQKEILYNMDFAYMEKDIYYNRLTKGIKEIHSDKHEKRVYELEEIQRNLTATNNLLTREVSRLEEDMRRITLDLQGDAKEQHYLKNKRQEKVMIVDCGQKQLKSLRIQNQNKQVDENVLKLRVRQAEGAIEKVGGKVFCLERQRLELDEAMKEREIEIKAMRDVLKIRRRVLTEQTSNMNSRISLAKLKIENLKSKYDVEILKMGKDENGEPLSITYIKIKGAQERFELQQIGDKLDSQIKKTEKEIEAMENTLKVVNATNKALKNNLQNVDPNSPEQLEKQRLEETQAKIQLEYRKKKAVLDSLQVITLDLEEEYQQKLRMEEDILNVWKEKDQQAAEIEGELREQEEKLERAGKQLKKLIKDIRGTKVQKFKTIEEKDIELRELMDQNEYCLQQLAELVAKTYDTGPVIVQYLSEKGLSLPMCKSPAPSMKCPSTASLPSARSSTSSKSSTDSTVSTVSRTSSCVFSPSVVMLDSAKLCRDSESGESSKERRPCGASRRKSQGELRRKGNK